MILEYLFFDETHKSQIEKYKYKNVEVKIQEITESDCWIARFFLAGENETSAKILSAVNDDIISKFQPTVLSNESSAYYNNRLYSHFNEFERKLRKLLYLKSGLSAETKESATIKDLESKDLGEIFELLFTDTDFVKAVRSSVHEKSWKFTKTEIIETLRGIEEKTVWDELIGKNVVPLLRTDFLQVKNFRNDVMHAHNMSAKDYADALKLITIVNEHLSEEINKFIVEGQQDIKIEGEKSFDEALGDMLRADTKKGEKSLQEQVRELHEVFSSLEKKDMYELYKNILNARNLMIHQQEFPELVKTSVDLVNTFKEIQNNIAQLKQYQAIISPEIAELQTLQNNVKKA